MRWTACQEVDALVNAILEGARDILGEQFIGMYLYGSLATGDFNADSDIDFLIVTRDNVGSALCEALEERHAHIAATGARWSLDIEGSYIGVRAVRRHDPDDAMHPHLERGPGMRLHIQRHESDWIIQRFVLYRYGMVVSGPNIKTLIDPVAPEALRDAARALLREWWEPMLTHPEKLESTGYQAYAAVTMCRLLYTLREADVVSKPSAVRWLRETDPRWDDLLTRALRYALTPDDLPATLALMRLTVGVSHGITG